MALEFLEKTLKFHVSQFSVEPSGHRLSGTSEKREALSGRDDDGYEHDVDDHDGDANDDDENCGHDEKYDHDDDDDDDLLHSF